MVENDEIKQQQEQPEAETLEAKKKKKPNFSKPFIISGILLGVFAGAPFLNLGNYILGLWGWVFGLLAAWFLSKEYKYFLIAHGGMVGFFTGLIGSVIAMIIDIGVCFAGFSTFTLVPSLQPALVKVTKIIGIWIPGRFHVDILRDNAVILPPWSIIKLASDEAVLRGEQAVSPAMKLTGHAFFMVPLLAGTAILGGIIGWKLFAKPAPKKKMGPMRQKRPAKPERPQPATQEKTPVEPITTGGEKASQANSGIEAEENVQPTPIDTPEEPGSFDYGSPLEDTSKDE